MSPFATRSGSLKPTKPTSNLRSAAVDSYDNALTETINGLYKAELLYKRGLFSSNVWFEESG